jgi:glycine oxidase
LNFDCAIIGGGIIGLSLAYELSAHGQRVIVVDTAKATHQASWAAAGVLPPADLDAAPDPYEALRAFGRVTLERWCRDLQEQTNVDPELRSCGAIHVARTAGELASLSASVAQWRGDGITAERVTMDRLAQLEPGLAASAECGTIRAAFHLPDEAQVRPPRLLRALKIGCALQGVEFLEAEFQEWTLQGDEARALSTRGCVDAAKYCVAAGAWSAPMARALAMPIEVEPWRGQMLLLACDAVRLSKVVYEGPNYIVPRNDGRVLVGSTLEAVGFDTSTTQEARTFLRNLANALVVSLRESIEEAFWAGVRPGTADGKPYMGVSPVAKNVFVATGHFRSGIAMAAGTAIVMRQLMEGTATTIEIDEFRPDR